MGTVASLIESARYDLQDYEKGLDYDDRMLYLFLNRMIGIMDSQLSALDSELVHGIEYNMNPVAYYDYMDLTSMNNGQWDMVRSVWIGTDRKQPISNELMYYKRKFRNNQTAEPEYWAIEGRRLLFEALCNSAHTDFIIHYNKKHRDRKQSWTEDFGTSDVNATTDTITLDSNPGFVTGDGPFQFTTTTTLPAGLSLATDYYYIFDPANPTKPRFATSKDYAINEEEVNSGNGYSGLTYKIIAQNTLDFTSYGASANDAGTYFTASADFELGSGDRVLKTNSVNITNTGTGTHTITMQPDLMPYDGIFDEYFREMLVLHAGAKSTSQPNPADAFYERIFRKRAFEEVINRKFVPRYYRLNY